MEDLVISKIVSKGDGKNYYGYDKKNNAYDIQQVVYNWAGTVYIRYILFRSKQRVVFGLTPEGCENAKDYIPNAKARRMS